MRYLIHGLQVVVLVSTSVFLLALALVTLQFRQDLRADQLKISYTFDNVNRLIREASQTCANLRHASAVLETNSASEVTAILESTNRTNQDLAALHDLIEHTDVSLNVGMVPLAEQAIDQQSRSLSDLSMAAQRSFENLAPVLRDASDAGANLARLSEDPALLDTLRQTQAAATNVARTTANLADTTADIREAVHRQTRPANWAIRVGGYALDLASKIGSLAAGFLR
jgi:septal ring factor EnvC (AmiA/AmiB activator)